SSAPLRAPPSFPTRRSSDLEAAMRSLPGVALGTGVLLALLATMPGRVGAADADEALLKDAKIATDGPGLLEFFRERTHSTPTDRSEEHTSELQSPYDLVCRL